MTTITQLDEIATALERLSDQLAALKKDLADRIDVRTSEIIESISGYSPHKLWDFAQERDHGIMYAEPVELGL